MTPPKDCLTEDDIERIAEKAAERALEKVYSQVGKSFITKILWFFGVVAQELAQVFPEAVTRPDTKDGSWSVDYSKMVPLILAAIQELLLTNGNRPT